MHHCYEFRLSHPRVPLGPAVLRSVAQFAYTTLFGWYACFVFVRTGSLPAVVLAHVFCNWMGLPRVWGAVEVAERVVGKREGGAAAVGAGGGGAGGARAVVGRAMAVAADREGRRARGLWTTAYYALLVAGAVGFWRELWPLTESERSLAKL